MALKSSSLGSSSAYCVHLGQHIGNLSTRIGHFLIALNLQLVDIVNLHHAAEQTYILIALGFLGQLMIKGLIYDAKRMQEPLDNA